MHTEILAVGLEDGSVLVYRLNTASEQSDAKSVTWHTIWQASAAQRHSAAVSRLAWHRDLESDSLLLASAGHDHAVNIYSIIGI